MRDTMQSLILCTIFSGVCAGAVTAGSTHERQLNGVEVLKSIGEVAEARQATNDIASEARSVITHPEVLKKVKELDVLVDVGPANLPKVTAFINQFVALLQAAPSELATWSVQRLTEIRGLAQAGNHSAVETKLHVMINALAAAPLTRPVVLAWLAKLDVLVDAGNSAAAAKMIEDYERDIVIPNSAPLAPWTCDRLDAILVPLKQGNTAAADTLLKKMIADLLKP